MKKELAFILIILFIIFLVSPILALDTQAEADKAQADLDRTKAMAASSFNHSDVKIPSYIEAPVRAIFNLKSTQELNLSILIVLIVLTIIYFLILQDLARLALPFSKTTTIIVVIIFMIALLLMGIIAKLTLGIFSLMEGIKYLHGMSWLAIFIFIAAGMIILIPLKIITKSIGKSKEVLEAELAGRKVRVATKKMEALNDAEMAGI